MKKLWLTVLTLVSIFMISGCNSDQVSTKPSEKGEHPPESITNMKNSSKENTDEQWILESNAEKFLQEKGIDGPYHFLVDDLDYDGIPEVVADFGAFDEFIGNHLYGFRIFKKLDNGNWDVVSEYNDDFVNEFHLYGVIEKPNKQKILVGSQTVASATNMYSTMTLFQYNGKDHSIQPSSNLTISDENPFEVNIEDNNIRLTILYDDGSIFEDELFRWESDSTISSHLRSLTLGDWSHYFDQNFLDKLYSGEIKGVPYRVETEVEIIKSELSDVVSESKYLGLPALYYNDIGAIYTYWPNENYITKIVYQVPNLSYDEMEKIMGDPKSRGVLITDQVYQEAYVIGHKKVYFESDAVDRNSGISKIILTTE